MWLHHFNNDIINANLRDDDQGGNSNDYGETDKINKIYDGTFVTLPAVTV
jgi:hypothetical protein